MWPATAGAVFIAAMHCQSALTIAGLPNSVFVCTFAAAGPARHPLWIQELALRQFDVWHRILGCRRWPLASQIFIALSALPPRGYGFQMITREKGCYRVIRWLPASSRCDVVGFGRRQRPRHPAILPLVSGGLHGIQCFIPGQTPIQGRGQAARSLASTLTWAGGCCRCTDRRTGRHRRLRLRRLRWLGSIG